MVLQPLRIKSKNKLKPVSCLLAMLSSVFKKKIILCQYRKENPKKLIDSKEVLLGVYFQRLEDFFYKKVFSVSIGRECVIKANRIQRSSVKCLFTMV